MAGGSCRKQKILIVDDALINRKILANILMDDYEILEAGNGVEALKIVSQDPTAIALILLDEIMPEMDGFHFLETIKERGWMELIPVIMISSEDSNPVIVHAFQLGVADFISRPFDALIVRRRVENTIMLYMRQKKLAGMVAEQIYHNEINSNVLLQVLSHIVEFRNGESGPHVLHIAVMSRILLQTLMGKTDRYHLNGPRIHMIATASTLHDIGKITIPDKILNKPGKLTREEFAVMKTHPSQGALMLKKSVPGRWDKRLNLLNYGYDICRWHHERWDGCGYPDGLAGDEIPISAQVVSIADVYDALTSVRAYKPAYTHERAMEMIHKGECGLFSPLLLECLDESQQKIRDSFMSKSGSEKGTYELMRGVEQEVLRSAQFMSVQQVRSVLSPLYRPEADEMNSIQDDGDGWLS